MIEIVMDGMCKGCTRADLELECYKTYIDERFWSISCTHKCACERIESKTIERLREGNEENYCPVCGSRNRGEEDGCN